MKEVEDYKVILSCLDGDVSLTEEERKDAVKELSNIKNNLEKEIKETQEEVNYHKGVKNFLGKIVKGSAISFVIAGVSAAILHLINGELSVQLLQKAEEIFAFCSNFSIASFLTIGGAGVVQEGLENWSKKTLCDKYAKKDEIETALEKESEEMGL